MILHPMNGKATMLCMYLFGEKRIIFLILKLYKDKATEQPHVLQFYYDTQEVN